MKKPKPDKELDLSPMVAESYLVSIDWSDVALQLTECNELFIRMIIIEVVNQYTSIGPIHGKIDTALAGFLSDAGFTVQTVLDTIAVQNNRNSRTDRRPLKYIHNDSFVPIVDDFLYPHTVGSIVDLCVEYLTDQLDVIADYLLPKHRGSFYDNFNIEFIRWANSTWNRHDGDYPITDNWDSMIHIFFKHPTS
jgi:hypothetical protein